MSGHNRWSKIKHQKAAQGATKGKLFTKLIKEITVSGRREFPRPRPLERALP
jgi:transcriptional/translational regulatory protein YebC/TACO1